MHFCVVPPPDTSLCWGSARKWLMEGLWLDFENICIAHSLMSHQLRSDQCLIFNVSSGNINDRLRMKRWY